MAGKNKRAEFYGRRNNRRCHGKRTEIQSKRTFKEKEMKRLNIAAMLFAVAVALCITSTAVTSRVEKKVGEPLERTIEFFEKGETEKAIESFSAAKQNWDDIKETTAVFASHSSVDELDEQMTLISALLSEQSDDFLPQSALCLLKVQNLCDGEKVTVKALF